MGDYTDGNDRNSRTTVVNYKWESCFTIQKASWGYDRRDVDLFYDTDDLLKQLITSVSCNG